MNEESVSGSEPVVELSSLESFYEQLQQEVLSEAEAGGGELLAASFTRSTLELLNEEGYWDDFELSYLKKRGVEVSAWGIDAVTKRLNICTTDFDQGAQPSTLPKVGQAALFSRASKFLEKSFEDSLDLEESSPASEAGISIRDARAQGLFESVVVYLVSNRLSNNEVPSALEIDGVDVAYELWDLERLHRVRTSGAELEEIDIDLLRWFGDSVPCLIANTPGETVTVYLAFLNGRNLAELYAHYGPRLLELNVRSFLMAKGKINRGIRDTIREQPDRFIAYNNGLTATASKVELTNDSADRPRITRLVNLQVVNGGQTTASLAAALENNAEQLDQISVQVKIAQVDPVLVDTLVPEISRYANRQNAVSEADLTANHPFHVRLEHLSRTVWAPAPEGGTRQTRWYYERSRGSYAIALSRESTPARKREFKKQHPAAQKFTKTDLAKYVNSWMLVPHLVSKGAQKSFVHFMEELERREVPEPSELVFQQIVARAIAYRSIDKIVRAECGGAWKAQTVNYSIALLVHQSGSKVDLDEIWRLQRLPDRLAMKLKTAVPAVKDAIIATAEQRQQNIGEWCKKEECWLEIQSLDVDLKVRKARSRTTPTSQPISAPEADAEAMTLQEAIMNRFGIECDEAARLKRYRARNWKEISIVSSGGSTTGETAYFAAPFENEQGPYALVVAVEQSSGRVERLDYLPDTLRDEIYDSLVSGAL